MRKPFISWTLWLVIAGLTIAGAPQCESEPNANFQINGEGQFIYQVDVDVGKTVALDASSSADNKASGVQKHFSWNLSQKPTGSSVELEDVDSEINSFIPDVEGLYEIELTFWTLKSTVNSTVKKTVLASLYNFTPTVVLTSNQILTDISFSNQNDGTVVGTQGGIFVTTDGGQSWSPKTSGTAEGLHSVSSISNTAYAVGENGTMLKSTNGGDSWGALPSITPTGLTGVSFVNRTTGYVCGGSPVILKKTTDGGTTWQDREPSTDGGLDDVFFIDEMNGFTVGSLGFFYTSDGGQSWGQAQSGLTNNGSYRIHFFDNQKGWIAGRQGSLAYTHDGGKNFSRQSDLPLYPLNDVHFMDEDNGMAVGALNTLLITSDGGANWHQLNLELFALPGYYFYAVHMVQADHIVLTAFNTFSSEGTIFLLN
jgi:photosystem II stability/assembly factor-like uncharacterized protein